MYKKILFVASLVAGLSSCSDDYTDWVLPVQNTQQAAQTLNVEIAGTASQTIDVASLTGDSLQVIQFKLSDNMSTVKDANLKLEAGEKEYNIAVSPEGKVGVSTLQDAVVYLYNPAPTERTVKGVVTATGVSLPTANQTTPLYTPLKSGEITFVVKPKAPVIESAYYVIGTVNGWNNTNQSYKFDNGGADPYENSVFTVTIPAQGGENKFKIAPASAYGQSTFWDGVYGAASGSETTMGGTISCPGGDIIIDEVANPGAKYKITINMMESTYSIEAVPETPDPIYLVGNGSGWNHDVCPVLAWDKDKQAFTGYAYMDGDFKFTPKGDWSGEYNGNDFTQENCSSTITLNGGGNISFTGAAGMYFVEVSLDGRYIKVDASTWRLVGDFNGWNANDDAQLLTYNKDAHCLEITGATVNANGWKFTSNGNWDINLGGDLSDLAYNGGNISTVGSTIRLYLERTKSTANDFKFHATVE